MPEDAPKFTRKDDYDPDSKRLTADTDAPQVSGGCSAWGRCADAVSV